MWPEAPPAREPIELTAAARRQAEAALEQLKRAGVKAHLDGAGRARFRSHKVPPVAARLIIERMGDQIEAVLNARAAEPIRFAE